MNNIAIRTTGLLAGALLLAAGTQAAAQDTDKRLYCWNENGQRICGDALPPDAVDNARTVFNAETGTRTGQVARALTDEERAAQEAAQAEAQRLAVIESERHRREMAMVESYATEAELRHAYQTRIDLFDATIKASGLGMVSLRQSLLGQLRRAGELELGARPVPDNLAARIREQHAALRRQQAILAEQQLERAALGEELAQAVERYRDLKHPDAEDGSANVGAPEND